jgi:tetratricopeptide (TPR) repeat protein
LAANQGIDAYNVGNYARAAARFNTAAELAKDFNVIDSLAVFNAALSYEKAAMPDKAIEGYMKSAEIGYNVPNVYLFAANIHKMEGDTTAALNLLQDAFKKHDDSQTIIIEILNIYLTAGDYVKAVDYLNLAIEKDPANEVLYFSKGSVNDQLGNYAEAEAAYMQALEVKPDYFDANYNLGALYFNKGVEKVNAANEIKDNTKYQAALEEANGIFKQARPYLEKAHEIDSEDVSTMRSLKDVYVRLGEDDLFMEMNNKLKGK